MSDRNIFVIRWDEDGKLHSEFIPDDAPSVAQDLISECDADPEHTVPTEPAVDPKYKLVRREIGNTGLYSVIDHHVWGQ